MAQHFLSIRHEIPVVHEDKDLDFYIHQRWDGNSPLTVLEIRADNIQPEKFIQFFQHYEEKMPLFQENVRITRLPNDHGFKVVHQRVEMPFLISNRSFFNCYYEIDGSEPGEYQFIVSGWGNEFLATKYAKMAGKNVIGTVNINYIGIRPYKNHYGEVVGTFVQQVQSINPNGSLPDMLKSKQAKQSAKNIRVMLEYLRTHELCECSTHLAKGNMTFENGRPDRQQVHLQQFHKNQRMNGRAVLSLSPSNVQNIRISNSKGFQGSSGVITVRNALDEPPKQYQLSPLSKPTQNLALNQIKVSAFKFEEESKAAKPLQTSPQSQSKGQRAKTIQVPKEIRDQLKKEIVATLNRDKNSQAVVSEFTNKATSDFVVKNYRSKQSMLSRGKSAKDLFEFNEKGILIMKDEKGTLL